MTSSKALFKKLANIFVAGAFVFTYVFGPIAPLLPSLADKLFLPVEKAEAATVTGSVDWNGVARAGPADQVIDGFGAAFPTIGELFYNHTLTKPWASEIMDKLFDPNKGIGLSIARIEPTSDDHDASQSWRPWIGSIKPTENGPYEIAQQGGTITNNCGTGYESMHDKHQVWLMCEAKNRFPGMKFHATVWSPPPYMKTNNSYKGDTGGPDEAGSGYLRSDKQDQYADYLATYVKEYRDKFGINISQVSFAHEPDTYVPYQGAYWHASDPNGTFRTQKNEANISEFLPKLTNAFSTKGVSSQTATPELGRWVGGLMNDQEWWSATQPQKGVDTIITSAGAHVGIVNLHGYDQMDNGVRNSDMSKFNPVISAQNAGKHVWMTEQSLRFPNDSAGNNMSTALIMAENIHKNIVNAQANAWMFWTAVAGNSDGQVWCYSSCLIRVDGPYDTNGYEETKSLYALGSYSKFIRPGSVRLNTGATLTGDLFTSAYKNASTGQFVYVAVNKSASSHSLTINVANNPGFTELTPFITDATRNMVAQDKVNIGSSFTIPPQSIVTFVRNTGSIVSPPSVTLTSADSSVVSGGNSLLSWSVSGATSCTASALPLDGGWTGSKSITGSSQPLTNITVAKDYKLSCTGAGGTTERTVNIGINNGGVLQPSATLTSTASSVAVNTEFTLNWSSSNATAGCVGSGGLNTNGASSGQQKITPPTAGTYTYKLTCSGAVGTTPVEKTQVVTVTPVVTGLNVSITSPANGASITYGTPITLSATLSGTTATAGSKNILASIWDGLLSLITYPGRVVLSLFGEGASEIAVNTTSVGTEVKKTVSNTVTNTVASVPKKSLVGAAVVVTPAGAGKFTVGTNARTSGGIFRKSDNTLVRTLWSNELRNAGTEYTITWDGNDDNGTTLSPPSEYEARVVAHNVTYEWEGVVGNTSANKAGADVWRSFEQMWGTAFAPDGRGFLTMGYNEQQYALYRMTQDSYKGIIPMSHDDYKRAFQFIAVDSGKAYFANNGTGGGIFDPTKFIIALDITNPSYPEYLFSSGSTYGEGGNQWKSVIDKSTTMSGLAVQQNGNYLFVSHKGDNIVKVFDKNSGAFIKNITVASPGALAVNSAGDLWVASVSGKTVTKFTNISSTPTASVTLSGFSDPLALAVSLSDGTLVVADGGISQQLKGYSDTGTVKWTYGVLGGNEVSGPDVSNDKFLFRDRTYWTTRSHLSFSPNGKLWVGDVGNERTMIYTIGASGPVYSDQIVYLPHSYTVAVDPNNPTRVFNYWQEFSVDYSRPVKQSWTLVKNWSAGLDKNRFKGFAEGLTVVTTLTDPSTGVKRTFALAPDFSTVGPDKFVLFEMPTSGIMRETGIKFPESISLYPDGSKRWAENISGVQKIWSQPFTGFNGSGNPTWGSAGVIATAPAGAKDPYYRGGFSGTSGPRFPTTSNNKVVIFDPAYANAGSQSTGFHLGAVNTGGTSWSFRASPGTRFTINCPFNLKDGAQVHDCWYQQGEIETVNSKGAFETARVDIRPYSSPIDLTQTVDTFNDNGSVILQYAGNRVLVVDNHIVYGYHGEYWNNGQASQSLHFLDNGLFIGQFGKANYPGPNKAASIAGAVGNAFSPAMVKGTDGNVYLYMNDESVHAGITRWKINGLDTIGIQSISLDGTPVNSSPTTTLTSPSNGTNFSPAPANITVSANASDSDGSIARVEFYNGATLINSDTTSPYSYTWSAPQGTYSLSAKAVDNLGATGNSSTATVTVGTVNPTPTATISVIPTSIVSGSGQTSMVTWSSTNTTGCTATGGWTGAKGTGGQQPVSPTVTTTYYVQCTGAGGQTSVQSATLTVTTPPTAGYKVEFFKGSVTGTKIGEATATTGAGPFTTTWADAVVGDHTIIAKVTDVATPTNTAVSAPVNITVRGGSVTPDGSCTSMGTITRDVWTGVAGGSVDSIPFASNPNSSSALTLFDAPINVGDNFGQRIRGYICPQVSGNYTFWIAGDNESRLYISLDGNPANKILKASVAQGNWTNQYEWTKFPSQVSVPVSLVANQRYYIEAVGKDDVGGDNLSVGWQLPSGTQERPIPGAKLAPWGSLPGTGNENPDPTKGDLMVSLVNANNTPVASSIANEIRFITNPTQAPRIGNKATLMNVTSGTRGVYQIPDKEGYAFQTGVCTYKRSKNECNTAVSTGYPGSIGNTGAVCTGGFCQLSNGVTADTVTKSTIYYLPGVPIVTLTAPASVTAGTNARINWNVTTLPASNGSPAVTAPVCTASGGWTGTKTASGQQDIAVNAPTTFTLTCKNSMTNPYSTGVSKIVTVGITGSTNVPPVVTLSSPQFGTGEILEGSTLTLHATVIDTGTPQSVEFFNNGVKLGNATYDSSIGKWVYNYASIRGGSYHFTAVATDSQGAKGESADMPASVSSYSDSDPVLKIVGATTVVAGSSITAQVINRYDWNTDPSFTIYGVDFYRNGVRVGNRVTTYPATMSIPLPTAGTYTITTKLVESYGGVQGEDSSNAIQVTATPTTSGSPTFLRGINFGPTSGDVVSNPVTIEGNLWMSQAQAQNSAGLTFTTANAGRTSGTTKTLLSQIPNTPAGDASNMLNTNIVWTTQGGTVEQTITNGSYDVYLYSMENYLPNFRKYSVSVEGQADTIFPQQNFQVGQWAKYGPYRTNVTDGKLTLVLGPATAGDPQIMGMAIYTVPSGTAATFDSLSGQAKSIIIALLALIALSLAGIIIHHHRANSVVGPRF